MKYIIEVGANSGSHTERFISDDSIVFAFEPSEPLYLHLINKFRDNSRVIVLPFAVDIENSVKTFNVSLSGDCGVGSLYDFHEGLKDTILGRHEVFQSFSGKQKTLTIRLDTFLNGWKIPYVDYLHIDAQGSDFNCIKSLGERIKDVREGVCECTWKIPLYSGVDNYYENVKEYLEKTGNFKVDVAYEHQHQSEIDLRFYR